MFTKLLYWLRTRGRTPTWEKASKDWKKKHPICAM